LDPAETLFKGLLRIWHRVRGEVDPPKPGAALLSDHADRISLLGALLFGVAPDVVPAARSGGLVGDALLLPRRVELFDRVEDNALVYLYRVAVASAARELGMDRVAPPNDERVAALATLLAMPAVLEHLHAIYPASRALTVRLAAAELATRAPAPRSAAGAIEALVQARLRAASDVRPAPSEGDAQSAQSRWLAEALVEGGSAAPDAIRARAIAASRELSRLGDVAPSALPEVLIWGRLWPPGREIEELEAADAKPRSSTAAKERTVISLDRTIRLERQKLGAREDKPLFHMFEKLETAEDYRGQSATPDATGSVDQMKDALNELSLGTAIRTTEDPRNLVRAEIVVDPGGLEIADRAQATEGRVFRYPEWHHQKNAYREDWVTVVEERLLPGQGGSANAAAAREILRSQRRHVDEIRGHLIRTLHRRQMRDRQTYGPEIDINAMVARHADLVAGRTPSDRLYLGARRALREIAVLVLVDTSFSTDAWLEGRRVLDVEIESLLVLSAALEGVMEEEVAVASFRSHSRTDVRFGVLKGFADTWAHLRRVAPGLEPEGYTRIGAAMRHATAVLDQAHARKKLLLIVSDGKPTDYDRYEGRYGVEDVRKAVREASQRRIHCFGLAIESEAKLHLARIYRVLPRTSLLPGVMADVFLGMLTD
jgi:nitric oxide reductase activation protein